MSSIVIWCMDVDIADGNEMHWCVLFLVSLVTKNAKVNIWLSLAFSRQQGGGVIDAKIGVDVPSPDSWSRSDVRYQNTRPPFHVGDTYLCIHYVSCTMYAISESYVICDTYMVQSIKLMAGNAQVPKVSLSFQRSSVTGTVTIRTWDALSGCKLLWTTDGGSDFFSSPADELSDPI